LINSHELIVFHVSAIMTAILLAVSWKKTGDPVGRSFFILLSLAFIWVVSFLVELSSADIGIKIITTKIQTTAATLLPIASINMVLIIVNREKYLRYLWYLFILPVITDLIVWFVPKPNWFWGHPRLIEGPGSLMLMNYDYGFWFYYVQMPYTYILIVLSIILLIINFMRAHLLFKLQIVCIFLAFILPAAAGVIYILNESPIRSINYTSATFSLSCLLLYLALFKYGIFDLITKARYMIVENMDDGIIVLDKKRRILDINPTAAKITGSPQTIIGGSITSLDAEIFRKIESMIDKDNKREEIQIMTGAANEYRVYDIRQSTVSEKSGRHSNIIFTISDYTEKAETFNKMYEQSIRDVLTGIYNRRFIYEQGMKDVSRVKRNKDLRISVLVIDIDKMKMINDLYGHMTGDQLLTSFTDSCSKLIRVSDIFGRLGGDEFALILPDTDTRAASIAAQRIIDSSKVLTIPIGNDSYISVDISVGLICSESLQPEEISIDNMIKIADDYMYKAKNQGGGKVLYPKI
jgi:diguanylate cyclase (GGDEF)-like protein/PAS domain S-box-containing protein